MKNYIKINWKLIGLIILAAVVRAVGIQSRSIQYDDAFSIILSSQSFSKIIIGTAADTMPPLYYFLLHIWMSLGRSICMMRMLSLFFSLGTLVFTYLIAIRIFNKKAAYWACLIFALSPIHFYHSQDIRMYAMLTFLLAIYIYLFIVLFQDATTGVTRAVRYILFILVGATAFYCHNLAGFLLLIPDVYLLITKNNKRLISLIISQGFSFLLFLPWLAFVPGQISKIQSAFWTPEPGLAEVFQALIMFTSNLPLPGVFLPIGMISAALIFATLLLWIVKSWKRRSEISFPLVMFIFPPVVLFCVSYVMRPVFVPRGFLISSIGLFLIAGIFLDTILTKTPKLVSESTLPRISGIVVLVCFSVNSIIGLYTQYTYKEFPRSPFQDVLVDISKTYKPGDCIIHDNKLSYFPSVIYKNDLFQKFLPDEPGSPNDTFALKSQLAMQTIPEINIQSAVNGCSRIYFIVFNQAIEEYSLKGKAQHPIIQWLNANLTLTSKLLFNDLWVYQYQRQ